MHKVADSLYLDHSFVERVVYGPARSLFEVTMEGVWLSTPNLQSFLMDPSRAGDFYVPRTDPDTLLLRIITRQSLSRQPYSQDVWMDILAVMCTEPFLDLDISKIAFVLGVAPSVVESAVLGPTKSLFRVEDGGRVRFSTPDLASFLSDPKRAGQFSIPPNKCATLYTSILSRPPPTDPSQAYSHDVFLNVLAVVSTWEDGLTVPQIAALLDIDPSEIDVVVSGNPRPLFGKQGDRICFSNNGFAKFVSNHTHAGQFFVSGAIIDNIFTRILSRTPTNPSQAYSRDVLVGVLAVVRDWEMDLTVSEIADVLNVDPSMVNNVIQFGSSLFSKSDSDMISFSSTAFAEFISDAERAGEYFPSNIMLDPIYTRILSCHPMVPDALRPSSRQTLLDVLAALTPTVGRSMMLLNEIAYIVNTSLVDLQNVVQGPASAIFLSDSGRRYCISVKLKEFLQDVDRAGDFYIAEEDKVRTDARYSHYTSIYDNCRRVLSRRVY